LGLRLIQGNAVARAKCEIGVIIIVMHSAI